MTGEQTTDTIWYLLALILVGSALMSRRISFRHGLGMALVWIGIFGIAATAYSYRHIISAYLGEQKQAAVIPEPANSNGNTQQHGLYERIELAPDGHFWVNARINGTPARFMIDSGASITALSSSTARQAGLNVDSNEPGVAMRTANGTIIAQRSSVASLTIGDIQASDVPVIVSESFGDINVIGMNYLSRLKSWRVENGEMILEP